MGFLFNGGAEIFISAVFLIVAATIVISIVKGLQTWKKNNESPRLSVEAVVAAKRAEVHTFHQPNAGDATGMHGYPRLRTQLIMYVFSLRLATGWSSE